MLVYIWMCVMLQAFAPGGQSLSAHYVNALQSHVRAHIDTVVPEAPPARPTPTQRVRQMSASASAGRAR